MIIGHEREALPVHQWTSNLDFRLLWVTLLKIAAPSCCCCCPTEVSVGDSSVTSSYYESLNLTWQ